MLPLGEDLCEQEQRSQISERNRRESYRSLTALEPLVPGVPVFTMLSAVSLRGPLNCSFGTRLTEVQFLAFLKLPVLTNSHKPSYIPSALSFPLSSLLTFFFMAGYP